MGSKWQWATSTDTVIYTRQFVLRVMVRVIVLLVLFNLAYPLVRPLDRSELTLYNRVFPGRLRFGVTNAGDPPAPVVSEFRLSRLIADHIISAPKLANEY